MNAMISPKTRFFKPAFLQENLPLMYRSLQAVRAGAALLVVLFHIGATMSLDKYFGEDVIATYFSFGDAGVEIFFVLSGFIIYHAHRSDISAPHKLAGYVWKRLTRVYPVYWIIFFLVYFSALAVPSLAGKVPHDFGRIIQSLLLFPQNKEVVGGTGAAVLVVAWSLQYEMIFYLFFAVMILNLWAALAIGFGLLIAYFSCSMIFSCGFPLSFISADYMLLFGMGMALSWLHNSRHVLKRPILLAIAGFFLFTGLALDEIVQSHFFINSRTLLYGLAGAMIILGLARTESEGRVVGGQQWIQLLGNSSFSLYLIHFPLISILCKLLVRLGFHTLGTGGVLFAFFAMLMVCILCAVFFHVWVERPLMFYLRGKFGSLK